MVLPEESKFDKIIQLQRGEEIEGTTNCKLETTRTKYIKHIETKRVLLIFPKKIEAMVPKEDVLKVKGTLVYTNQRVVFVQSKGIIFGEDKMLLSIPYENIAGISAGGTIFKHLNLSIQNPSGKTENYKFLGLDGQSTASVIKELKRRALEKLQERGLFCPQCGKEVSGEDKFCKNCGSRIS